MARQLTLLEVPPAWHLDAATREAGRKGIAAARASLRAAAAAAASEAARTGPADRRTHRRTAA